MVKAIGLFSGGLDSLLATRMLQNQKIDVLCLCFVSPFFGPERAREAATLLGVPFETFDFTDDHLAMVKRPPHGYGKNMNPCIDCHAMMLTFAGRLMEERGYDFLYTGEVLGERPMSQNRNALRQVAKLSGYRDRILRPLSARLLDETQMERDGLVDRARLGEVSGRSRKPQMAMAVEFGISSYETPAGGCILTDPSYSKRLRTLLERWPEATGFEVRLLRMGRVFWVADRVLAIVGRRKAENDRLEAVARPEDGILHVHERVPGASVLLTGTFGRREVELASRLAVRFSDAPPEGATQVVFRCGGEVERLEAERLPEDEVDALR